MSIFHRVFTGAISAGPVISGPVSARRILASPIIAGQILVGLAIAALVIPVSVAAQETPAAAPVTLAELAAKADVIVLAQIRDTDYVYQREFPIRGSAYLRVLIPYKTDQPLDIVEVYEEGLKPNECYFPNPTVFEEGRRYLLFLRRDPDNPERYRGLPEGCALDVLVDEDYRYVLRLPVDGIDIADPLDEHAEALQFADSYARETDESIGAQQRDEWLAAGWIRRDDDGFVYTRGVNIATVRDLMGPQGVSPERQRQPAE